MKDSAAICAPLAQRPEQARPDPTFQRRSLDSQAAVKVGPLSRHGYSRVKVPAADHDFKPTAVLNPVGIFLPDQNEPYLSSTASPVTADFRVPWLRPFWLSVPASFPGSRPCG